MAGPRGSSHRDRPSSQRDSPVLMAAGCHTGPRTPETLCHSLSCADDGISCQPTAALRAPRQGTSTGQQCGLGMIWLANSGRPKAVVNVPYCLSPPNVLPFVICPNSQTQVPLTLACVQ